ncbi:MAG: MerR family transcriptional regulator [Crocinitomicaceae bacterium]|nr:MerR family transcriptional regulator [Crocinitomicaceae bacterium]
MAEYSIKDLENFTNIKAHTLRIWEQRYALLEPKRTDTNIRYYSDKDLKKILNINLLYNQGYKISRIATMSESEIMEQCKEYLELKHQSKSDHVDYFIRAVIELDEKKIQKRLEELNDDMGTAKLFVRVLIPLLQKIGDLWQVDTISVSHEHFLSNILREFLILETAKLLSPKKNKGTVILFLHEREMHELSLLYYHFLLKSRGYLCFYLGQNVPLKDLKAMVSQKKPDYVFTSVIAETDHDYFKEFMDSLCKIVPANKIFMGGHQMFRNKSLIPSQVHWIQAETDIDI